MPVAVLDSFALLAYLRREPDDDAFDALVPEIRLCRLGS